MPLCNSAFTYSSSKPGKRDTAEVFSCTVLIGSAVGLRGNSAVAFAWLTAKSAFVRWRCQMFHHALAPAREVAFAPGERLEACSPPISFVLHPFPMPANCLRIEQDCRLAHEFAAAKWSGAPGRRVLHRERFDACGRVAFPASFARPARAQDWFEAWRIR